MMYFENTLLATVADLARSANNFASGLTAVLPGGSLIANEVKASYAIGSVAHAHPGSRDNDGLSDRNGAVFVTTATVDGVWFNSETVTSTVNDAGRGKTTAELQTPTGYTGIYANWNLDLEPDGALDAPWDFGTSSEYPALKADRDGDGTATWQEFGAQGRKPAVSITPVEESVTETETARFRVTSDLLLTTDLTVNLGITAEGAYIAAENLGSKTVTIPAGGRSATFDVSITNDNSVEIDGSVTATVADGTDYKVGVPASAVVVTLDNDSGVCNRTQVVQDAILAAIPTVSRCELVIDANLAAIAGTFNLGSISTSQSLFAAKLGDFDGLSSLETLNLSSNWLTTLPPGVFDKLPMLTTLRLENNLLTLLLNGQPVEALPPGVFNNLSALTTLYLNENLFTSLPSSGVFDSLSSLTTLNLGYGQLTSLPSSGVFDSLSSLTTLNLGYGQLTSLPPGAFDGLSALTTLDLQYNQLTSLPPGAFDDLSSLTTLYLQYNQLTTLSPDAFDGLSALPILNLNNNRLSTLPAGVFDGLSTLTTLNLNTNRLTALPEGVFDGLSLLTSLWVTENRLTALPSGVFTGLSQLSILQLEHNSVDPLPVPVFLELAGDFYRFKATVPTGAPFEIVMPVTVVNGSIDGGGTTLTIPVGAVESETVTVTRGSMATAPVTADINLPSRPGNHSGYSLVKDANLPFQISPPIITIEAGPAVTEGTAAQFTVTVNPAPAANLDVSLTIGQTGGYVAAGNLGGKTVRIPSNMASATYSVNTVGDDIDKANGTVTAALVDGTGYAVTTTQADAMATVTVNDDDTRGIAFDPSSVTVVENAGTGSYEVALTSEPTANVTVTLALTEVEGTGAVALASAATLTFTTGTWNTPQTVNLTITDDDIDNPNDRRTARISHTATGGGDYGANSVAADLTVTDDEIAAPITSGTILAVAVAVNADHDVNAAPYFTGAVDTYAASSNDDTTATVEVSGSTVTVTGVAVGSATITVTAANTGGSAEQTFMVTVIAAPVAAGPSPTSRWP